MLDNPKTFVVTSIETSQNVRDYQTTSQRNADNDMRQKQADAMAPPRGNLTGFDRSKLAASSGMPAKDPWARA